MCRVARDLIVWVLCVLIAMPPQWVFAADPIIIDGGTPTTQVTVTPSGKPMLNITAPNGAGVSHNTFTNFNVTNQGLVINNATSTVVTGLAGAIEANPNFSGGAASLILNEVTSSNRSTLNGPTEIGGHTADYILANPNGITCDGCGFINTPRATLTTGTPIFSGGTLSGLSVNGGDVAIEGLGLDATQASKFDIVTRAAALNAQINAQDLGVHAGRQDFDYTARSGTAKADDGSSKPAFAIDSTALGGMYAGRITLVGTEAGVGVRTLGDMAVSASDMVITAKGTLELKSNLSAAANVNLTSTSADVTTDKTVYAGGNLIATASAGQVKANTGGSLGAANTVTVNAATVLADAGGKIVAGMNTAGALTTAGNLNVTATTSIAIGDGFLGGGVNVTLRAPTIDLSRATDDGSETVRSRGTLTIQSPSITATNGKVASDGAMVLIGDQALTVGAGAFNAKGDVTLSGTAVTSAAAVVSDGNVTVTSTTSDIVNAGTLTAGTTATLSAAANLTNSGTIQSQTGTTLTAAGTITTQSGSKVKSATDTQVNVPIFTNGGSVYAVNDLRVNVALINNTGTLAAGNNLTFATHSLTNTAGVLHAENALTVGGSGGVLNATLFDNASGVVETINGDIVINADTIKNRKSQFGYANSSSRPTIYLNGDRGPCVSWTDGGSCRRYAWSNFTTWTPLGRYDLKAASNYGTELLAYYYEGTITTDSPSGLLTSGEGISLTGTTVSNANSTVYAVGDIAINTTTLNNEAVTLYKELYLGNYLTGCYNDAGTGMWYCASNGLTLTNRVGVYTGTSTVQAGGNLATNATGGVRNGTEVVYAAPPAGTIQVTPQSLAVAQTPSNLIDTTQYAALIPGRDALFVVSAAPKPKFLYETRAEFVNLGLYYGSDYFLSKFSGFDPEALPTRLGDAYFETQLVRQAIVRETGQRWLNDAVKDDIQQMKALLDGGVSAGRDLKLAFGVTLTQAQIDALTSDIIWYETAIVDGHTVLVPKVYLAHATSATFDPKGAILSGHDVTITADTIANDHGVIQGESDVALTASGDIASTSGKISSSENITLTSIDGDVTINTQVDQHRNGADNLSVVHERSTISAGGNLTVSAANDIAVLGADVAVQGNTQLDAGNDVTIGTKVARNDVYVPRNTTFHNTTNIGSTLTTGANLTVNAGGDAKINGSQVTTGGDATVAAIGAVTVEASSDTFDAVGQSKKGRRDEFHSVTQNAATLKAGGNLSLTSGADARITASTLKAEGDLNLQATGDVLIESAADSSLALGKAYKKQTVTQQRAELSAGGDVAVGSLVGNVSIISSKIDAGGDLQLTTPGGTLYLGARKDYFEEQLSSSKSGMFMTTYSNRGAIDETVVPTLLTADGNLAIVTAGGVIVDYKDTGNLNDSIDQLSQAPGLAWMNDLRGRTDVQWNAVQEAHQHWDYRSQGISPTGAALISLAVSFAMPAGVGAGFTGAKAGSTFAAVSNAGFEALVSQAAQALVGNGGDIGAALQQLGSSATLKSLATSMVTAGLIEGLGVSDALSTPTNNLTGAQLKLAEFTNTLKVAMAEGTIGAVVDSAINGAPLGDNLKSALVSAAVTVVGAEAAQQIGLAAAGGDINKATQLIAHAALGCGMGAATSGDCQSGAIGGAAGELTAWGYQKMTVEGLAADILAIQQTAQTQEEARALFDAATAKWVRSGVDLSRLSGALAAAAAGGDAQTAATTAGNAAENNAFFIIPLIILAASAGYATYVGDGDPLQGLANIGGGDDPLSQALSDGVETGVTLAMDHYPIQTQATLDVLEAFGNSIDATITYMDDLSHNVVSAQWNALDPTLRNQLKGAGKIVSVALPSASVSKIAQVKTILSAAKAVDAKIVWKAGILEQGLPWESHLETLLPPGTRLPQNFKTFDFYDDATGVATSAKTMDTLTAARLNNPSTIYNALKGHIDAAADFTKGQLSDKVITTAQISSREIQLAVPSGTTAVQWQHLARAIEYGQSRGVNVIITKVK